MNEELASVETEETDASTAIDSQIAGLKDLAIRQNNAMLDAQRSVDVLLNTVPGTDAYKAALYSIKTAIDSVLGPRQVLTPYHAR